MAGRCDGGRPLAAQVQQGYLPMLGLCLNRTTTLSAAGVGHTVPA